MPCTASASRRGVANALAPSYTRPAATSRSVTSFCKSSEARGCMRAGISSDRNSSNRSGIVPQRQMRVVADRRLPGLLAGAQERAPIALHVPFHRLDAGALVRAVAERLALGAAAAAPPV